MRGSWRLNRTAIYWPPLFWLSQPFFPVLLGFSSRGLCWDMVIIPVSSLQLTRTSCRWGYIIIWRPPTSCEHHNFALNSTPRLSRLPLISWYLWLDAPVIYAGAFLILTAWPGWRSISNSGNTPSFQLIIVFVWPVRVTFMDQLDQFETMFKMILSNICSEVVS